MKSTVLKLYHLKIAVSKIWDKPDNPYTFKDRMISLLTKTIHHNFKTR